MPQTVDRIDFAYMDVDPSQWPKLSCGGSNLLQLEAGSLQLEAGRTLTFADNGQVRSFDDTHKLVFNRTGNLLELHEAGDIRFLTGAPTPTEKLRIRANGSVGIGTDTPGAMLHVVGAIHTDGNLRVTGDTDVSGNLTVGGGANLHNGAQVQGALQVNGTLTATAIELNGAPLRLSPWTEVVGGIAFTGGNVGIRTVAPGAPLHLHQSDIGEDSGLRITREGKSTVVAFHIARNDYGYLHLGGNTHLRGGGRASTFEGNVGIGTLTPGAKLQVTGGGAIINGVTVGTDMPGLINYPWEYETVGVTALNFNLRLQSPNAVIFHSGDALQQQMIVNEVGNVGIGTIGPGAKLHVANGGAIINGVTIGADAGSIDYPWEYETIGVAAPNFNLRLQSPNSVIFHPGGARNNVISIDPGGNIGHARGARCDGSRWIDGSSLAYKTAVDPLSVEKALTTLVGLAPVIFRYKTEDDDTRHVGFIAEEVPDLVAVPDRKGVSAMDIVAILTKVVQHQQRQITELYAQLEAAPTQADQAPSALSTSFA